jgi:hypothetical protein
MTKNFKKIIFFFYITLLFLVFFKIEYLNPLNTLWLYNDNSDNAAIQAGWYFFKNDIWRFPLGLNPNYGQGLDNTIIVSDGIPILAIFFKLLAPFIKSEFQYISAWYFLCFFLQFYFAFRIINLFTKNFYFSFISANFFIIAPVFLYRLTLDPVQSAHWILLWFLYNLLKYKFELSIKKILLILLIAVSINIYFVAIISVPIFLLFLFKFFYNLDKRINLVKKFLIIYSSLLLLMFVLGYFETPISSSVGGGFGVYNLNLLTIFDSVVHRRDQIWSNFFTSIDISQNSKVEAFNYLGLGQFSLILLSLLIFCKRGNIFKTFFKFEKKYLFFLGSSLIVLFFIALSNKIYFGNILLLEIKLNNYFLGVLSIFRVSARFFWLVTYLILALSILIIFFEFSKKKYFILLTCLVIQLSDTFPGIKKNFKHNFDTPIKNFENFNDIFSSYKIINISYPENYSDKFVYFSGYFEKFKTISTNFSVQARFNKKKGALSRVAIYQRLFNKDIQSNEAIIIDNISHLKHLKTTLNKDDFVFLFRNNFWFLAKKGKLTMSESEIKELDSVYLDPVVFDQVLSINLKDPKYFGLGWTYPREYNHVDNKLGAWSEGEKSTLLFRSNGDDKFAMTFFYEANVKKKDYEFLIDILVNNNYYKKVLINNREEKSFSIIIDPKNFNSKDIIVEFNFSKLKSSWEQVYQADFRLLGIKLKSIQFKKIT